MLSVVVVDDAIEAAFFNFVVCTDDLDNLIPHMNAFVVIYQLRCLWRHQILIGYRAIIVQTHPVSTTYAIRKMQLCRTCSQASTNLILVVIHKPQPLIQYR